MGGSSDSDFGLSRSHQSNIDFNYYLNGVFHEQQLLVIVVNVMLHAFFIFSKMEAPNFV